MKNIILASLMLVFCLSVTPRVCPESNDSLKALTNAQAAVQMKLDKFAKDKANYELLVAAQKLSASLNPRGDRDQLSKLDEACLRLQLKVLLALAEACDPYYDPTAPTNRVYMNVAPPLYKGTQGLMAGMDPKAIKDVEVRRAYEEAIAKNDRRNEKYNRETAISRARDYALISVWNFAKRGFPETSTARREAIDLVQKTISDKGLRDRFNSERMPGLTW